jgi:hypothetical protein
MFDGMTTALAVVGSLIAMTVLTIGASVTGQQEKLCNALGGHYAPAPQGQDVCPDGTWLNLINKKMPK